jgi:amino acid transporter
VFGQKAIVGGTRGLTITALIIIVLANLVDLTAIASLGSVVALVIFIMVALAGWRLRAETGSRGWVIMTAMVVTAVVLVIFLVQTLRTEPQTFVAMVGVLGLSVALEYLWSGMRRRRDPATASGV